MKKSNLTIKISGKEEFNIVCSPEDKSNLIKAADMVNEKIAEIKKQGKTVGFERVVIMASLNIASELLSQTDNKNTIVQQGDDTLTEVLDTIETTISDYKNQ